MNKNSSEQLGFHAKTTHLENSIFAWYYILVFLVAVPGNVLALWVFAHHKKNKVSTVFLKNLAVADVCYMLLLPMRIVYHLMDGHWPFGEILCRVAGYLFYLNMYCSLYFMTCISLDRFLAIVFPVQSLRLRKPCYATVIVVILWLVLIITMLPMLTSKQTVQAHNVTLCKQLYREHISKKAVGSLAVAFTIPLVTIVVSYVLIIRKLWDKHQERGLLKKKAIQMIVLILANFFIAFVPYHINRFVYISAYCNKTLTDNQRASLAFGNCVTSALTCISGILDPVMYFYLTKTFQKTLLSLFSRRNADDTEQPSTS
ncbi:GPR17 protein, partial [Amia calva]|nr:GPR17 protein [Amia calva]